MSTRSRLIQAQQALKEGRRHEARVLLQQAAQANPDDFRVWLWLAGLAASPRASLDYVERAERLQPNHPTIAKARAWAEERAATQATPASPERDQPAPSEVATATADSRASSPWRRLVAVAAGLAILLGAVLVGGGFIPAGEPAGRPEATPPAAAEMERENEKAAAGQFEPRNPVVIQPTETIEKAGTPVAEAPAGLAKVIVAEPDEPPPTWTVTPSPTATPSPTPTYFPTFVSDSASSLPAARPAGVGPDERWIDVNLTTQTLVAYEGDTPVYDSHVSSGTANHPTVTGVFRIWLRFQSQTMDGRRLGYDYYLENVPYVMYFYQDYALHGTFWHNNFGTPMSHGCVNLPTPVAEWIFNWSTMGTVVNVHY